MYYTYTQEAISKLLRPRTNYNLNFTTMKKLLLSFTIASLVIFSACSSKKEEPKRDMVLLNDAMYQSSVNADTAVAVPDPIEEEPAYVAPRPAPAKKATPPRKKYVAPETNRYDNNQTTVPPVVANPPASNTGTAPTPSTGTGTQPTAGTGTETTTAEKAPEKKDGISKGAKGAIIGGVGGAVVGGILTKKGKGAVLGGVIGAAGGYILGRKKDRQDGRVNDTTQKNNN